MEIVTGRPVRTWRKIWHLAERTLTAGRWPARLATWLGASDRIALEEEEVNADAPLGTARALRIAFASDFHMGPNTTDGLIDRSLDQLIRLAPDVLLLGGDFVSVRLEYLRDLPERLATIPAPLGRYAVLGNHDHWTDGPGVARRLQDAGIEMLTNRNVPLPAPFDAISLCGLDDHTSGQPDAEAAFRGARHVRVVLMHAPSNLLDIGDRRFTVALCGHTHGGQIATPSRRPIKVAHGPLSRRFNAGRFEVPGGGILLVSRGIGCSTLPVRLNAPPAVMTCVVRHTPS